MNIGLFKADPGKNRESSISNLHIWQLGAQGCEGLLWDKGITVRQWVGNLHKVTQDGFSHIKLNPCINETRSTQKDKYCILYILNLKQQNSQKKRVQE
jgi:hypothetical protein